MNGLNDMLANARDGLCGSGFCMNHSLERGPDNSRSWKSWGNRPPPPIPTVIHIMENPDLVFDHDDDDLLGLDFVENGSLLPTDLLLEIKTTQMEEQRCGSTSADSFEPQPRYPRQPIWSRDESENQPRQSTTSSLSASTDTDNAQILFAWMLRKPHASQDTPIDAVPATMAFILPLHHHDYTKSPRLLDNVDGSSYSSPERSCFWSAQPSSFSPLNKTATAPTEASSTASC